MHKQSFTFRVFALVAMSAMLALPVGAAQSQEDFWNATERKFYLHLAQYCDRPTALIRWLDEFDWKNDLDGCGGDVLSPASSWTDVFPNFVPLHANITTTTTAEMHIFLLSRAVDQTSVTAVFDAGYAKCEGSAGPELLIQEKVGGFHEFVIPCTFEVSGAADPLATATLTITVTATHTYGYGVEGDHASYVTLAGVTPAPPAKVVEIFEAGERPQVQFAEDQVQLVALPEASPKAKSASVGVFGVLAMVAAVVVVIGRRQVQ